MANDYFNTNKEISHGVACWKSGLRFSQSGSHTQSETAFSKQQQASHGRIHVQIKFGEHFYLVLKCYVLRYT